MANPNLDFVRKGLILARERGFAEVEFEHEGVKFTATLEPAAKPKAPTAAPVISTAGDAPTMESAPEFAEVTAGLVGYFRYPPKPVQLGDALAKGQIVGSISALGLANDVESKVEGEVTEILVEDNAPVMYGQALFRVKP